jgi:hypothetical protein
MEKDGVPNRKQGEGWSSKKKTSGRKECLIEARRRMDCLIGNK